MSTHNIDFYEDLTKIIFELSSNTHLISLHQMSAFNTCLHGEIKRIPQFNHCLPVSPSVVMVSEPAGIMLDTTLDTAS